MQRKVHRGKKQQKLRLSSPNCICLIINKFRVAALFSFGSACLASGLNDLSTTGTKSLSSQLLSWQFPAGSYIVVYSTITMGTDDDKEAKISMMMRCDLCGKSELDDINLRNVMLVVSLHTV